MTHESVTDRVRGQYNDLPFPARDPLDELKRFEANTYFYGVDRVCDVGYGGKLRAEEGIRVLVAGGGTGDAVVSFSEQLRGTPSEVIHLDISQTALDIARQRVELRDIPNVRFVQGSILDISESDLGLFDHIDCSGVLHHMEDPQAGLNALTRVIKPEGTMGLILYGTHGRAGIYETQADIKKLLHPGMDRKQQLAVAREFLSQNPDRHPSVIPYGEKAILDPDLYDLFLHEQDEHPFTVDMIYSWLGVAGLKLIKFVDPRSGAQFAYKPESYGDTTTGTLSLQERHALAERLSGGIDLHSFYVSRQENTMAPLDDPEMVPSFSTGLTTELRNRILARVSSNPERPLPIAKLAGDRRVRLPLGQFAPILLQQLDGEQTNQEILAQVAREKGLANSDYLRAEWGRVLKALRAAGWVMMRHQSVPAFPTAESLQSAFLTSKGHTSDKAVVCDVSAMTIEALLNEDQGS